jgi:hypothetical protein
MHCKYAAEADMFMKKLRAEGNSENEEEENAVEAAGERIAPRYEISGDPLQPANFYITA